MPRSGSGAEAVAKVLPHTRRSRGIRRDVTGTARVRRFLHVLELRARPTVAMARLAITCGTIGGATAAPPPSAKVGADMRASYRRGGRGSPLVSFGQGAQWPRCSSILALSADLSTCLMKPCGDDVEGLYPSCWARIKAASPVGEIRGYRAFSTCASLALPDTMASSYIIGSIRFSSVPAALSRSRCA